MSWLNLNDSINSLKGQISNFANNVLADDDQRRDASSSNAELEELRNICSKQQEEINYLKNINGELNHERNGSKLSNDGFNQSNEPWSWEVSENVDKDNTGIIADLNKTISELRNEKKELTSNLVLLDTEHQMNTEKLINMKNELQKEYDLLEDKYSRIIEENEKLTESEKGSKAELDDLKLKYQPALEKTNVPEIEITSKETCSKCEKLLEENQKFISDMEALTNEISVLKSNNLTLQKVLDDSEKANDEELAKVEEKSKLYESENKILVSELKKATQSIATFEKQSEIDADNCKKLAFILEGYEQQVSSLKQELLDKNSENTEDVNKMKNDFEELKRQLREAITDREQTHAKYINILTENMKRYADCDKSCGDSKTSQVETDPQILEFNHQVESIMNILIDLKSKCECFEKKLYKVTEEKRNILAEKNHEIEKLISHSELLSQEIITKTETAKDYQSECNELIKNNEMLINELKMLKNNSGLQTISESNEDSIILLEAQLESANKKIEELENIIYQKEKDSSHELALEEIDERYISRTLYEKLCEDYDHLKTENSFFRKEVEQLEDSRTLINDEREGTASTMEKMKTDLENLEYQYTEININTEILKEEVENYKKKVEELTARKTSLEKLNLELERNNEDIRSELNVVREKLLLEEDTRKQYESQIRNLTEKLQNAKMSETSLKLQYDTMSKELIGVTEAKYAIEVSLKSTLCSLDQCREDMHKLQEENEKLKVAMTELEIALDNEKKKDVEIVQLNRQIEELKIQEEAQNVKERFQNVNLSESAELKQENENLLIRIDELKQLYESVVEEKDVLKSEIEKLTSVANEHLNCHHNVANLESKIRELDAAKNELTNVIITKHQESVTYHNEIQRLTQVLNSEAEKNRNLEAQLQTTASNNSDIQKKDEEIEKLTDQNNFLRQKCEVLAQNLLEEQNRVQQIIAEHSTPSEKEQSLAKKLERLQSHLIEVEEHYTQELLRAEEKNAELQTKVNEIELREKNSSTMYTSVSIRANQHVETLKHQLQLITNQRDELRKRISDAEDHASKQEAALSNLQFVLEQFQKDKENDVQKETERIRRQINMEKKIQEDLRNEIAGLQSQLEDSKHGLLAASRLSDQLEQSKQLVTTLKVEVSQLKEKLQKNEEHLQSLSSQSDGKVDKSLIKNLIIGFVSTNNNLNKDQMQILKIIATVLDFNQQDHDKVNLNKPQQGWLSSFLSPQTSQGMSQESLSQAFVKFLENESKPRLVPSLLSSNGETPKSRKNSTTVPRQSPSVLSEVVLPTFADFAQNRNSSSILKDVLKDNS